MMDRALVRLSWWLAAWRLRRPGARRTLRDRALVRRLAAAFEDEASGYAGFHFYVQNGVVTLCGTIAHDLEEDALVGLVRRVRGVKAVTTDLRVVPVRFQNVA